MPHLEGARLPADPHESFSRWTNLLHHPSSLQDHFPHFPSGNGGNKNHNKNKISPEEVTGRLCGMNL
jgi:hypothetical protein